MKKQLIIIMMVVAMIFTLSGCATKTVQEQKDDTSITFTDGLNREVTVTNPEKVGVASGSFAECWLLAGGVPAAVTGDAITERNLDLPEDVIDLGSLKEPSLEVIMKSELDFVILMPGLKHHIEIGETLDKAGITHAYFDVETFDDYLNLMDIFTDITGLKDLYEDNGEEVLQQIKNVIENKSVKNSSKVLLLRSSGTKISARNSETLAGIMLKDLGCVNIADKDDALLQELSLEFIVQENPDYIFVVSMGDMGDAKAQFDNLINSNSIWSTVKAIENNKIHFLEKELFHYKPNSRWGESYEVLANILSED